MRDESYDPVISPDGHFEVIIEKEYDRGFYTPLEPASDRPFFAHNGAEECSRDDALLLLSPPGLFRASLQARREQMVPPFLYGE